MRTYLQDQCVSLHSVNATVPVLLLLSELPLVGHQVDLGAERHRRTRPWAGERERGDEK